MELQGIEEVGFKEELRFELVYDVAVGIGELAQQELHSAAMLSARSQSTREMWRFSLDLGSLGDARRSRREGSYRANSYRGGADTPVLSPLIAPFKLAQGAASPPRHSPSFPAGASALPLQSPLQSPELLPLPAPLHSPTTTPPLHPLPPARQRAPPADGAAPSHLSEHALPPLTAPAGARHLPAHDAGREVIPRALSDGQLSALRVALSTPRSRAYHYETDRFRRLREHFGVSAAAYARAFPDDVSELGSTWRQRLKESVSEGKSGSFFYRVQLGSSCRFIVKQITRAEKRTLMALLPAYEAYVESQGGRSFVQYLSCHSLPLRWMLAGKVYFVVMRNFFPAPPWLAFDLKGATANRRALQTRQLHESGLYDSGLGGSPSYGTLRDWEWMDIAMVVDIADDMKAELAQIISADAAFLASQGLLDYSLLVGIYRPPSCDDPRQHEDHLLQLIAQGGYISLDRQKVYFFGIIDVLERHSLRWKLQGLALTVGYHVLLRGPDADGVSALSPEEYADRFSTFALYEVLQLPVPPVAHLPPPSKCLACCRRDRGSLSSHRRWSPLWERRRRGLMKERIESERQDHMRRIEELERQLRLRESRCSYDQGTTEMSAAKIGAATDALSSGTVQSV